MEQPQAKWVQEGQQTTSEYWIGRINDQAAHSAERLVELRKLFLEAKSRLEHGQWQQMFECGRLRFGLRSAQKFMRIAKSEVLANTKNSALLPASIDALATLARLDSQVLETGIEQGKICPEMTIVQARQFVCGRDVEDGSTDPIESFNYSNTLESISKRVQKAFEKVPADNVGKIAKDFSQPARFRREGSSPQGDTLRRASNQNSRQMMN